MWSRCVLWDVSILAGVARPPLTILSPTSRSWCYPTTSPLLFLSFFSPAPPSPSLSCLRIRLLETCPYHFNLLSCTFLDISLTFVVPLILSFLILSSLVTPLIHLNILISATSNFFSCAFLTAHVSALYIIAGLTTVLYTFPLTLKLILRSHRIPDTLFQFFQPDCILCVISASKSPFSANVAPRYLNVFTRSKFSSCILIHPLLILYTKTVNIVANYWHLFSIASLWSGLDIDRWPAGPAAFFTWRASGSSTPLARRGQRA